jgi:RimJ/RimL family protein N-acetyltransferase
MPELPRPVPALGDESVSLREWTQADVPAMIAAYADPAIVRFSWPHSRPYAEADAFAFLAEQESMRGRAEELHFALVHPADTGAVLGSASLYAIDLEERTAAVGYWLLPAARRRGIATRAVRLLARWAFDELAIARLELTCGPENVASQRVAARCGFVREGVLRSHMAFKGGRRDTVLHGLLPGDLR